MLRAKSKCAKHCAAGWGEAGLAFPSKSKMTIGGKKESGGGGTPAGSGGRLRQQECAGPLARRINAGGDNGEEGEQNGGRVQYGCL